MVAQFVQTHISLSLMIFFDSQHSIIYNILFLYFILYMMTSVVDKYYRRIIQNIDNVRMKFDVSGLLVKSKEHDSKIDTNKNNISSNLSKINTNVSDISSNLSKINTNESDISSNLELINTNKSTITNNYNISQINKKI